MPISREKLNLFSRNIPCSVVCCSVRPEMVLEEKLMDLGIGEKDVGFYARQVKRGNTLVVVETDDDKAQQASDIMRHFNAKSSVS